MKQVVQDVKSGKIGVREVPAPLVRPGHVVIRNRFSLLSPGTERTLLEFAKKSFLGKARARPDHVKRVLEKVRTEGLFATLDQVRAKLDEPMAVGYSSAGVVLAVGDGVTSLRPGDLAASNGPHAEIVCVPKHLCAKVPSGVAPDRAAFAVLGAIALHGVRLARVGLGDAVFVVGLGLVGQLSVALLRAAGCRVLATDPDARRCDLAVVMGAIEASPGLDAKALVERTEGRGADAVVVCASTASDGPVELAAEAVRKKGRVVLVGAVGMTLPRRPLYFKEAEVVVSCSYGPGRYDPDYEDHGHDYPAAYVRWTEGRNLDAVLGLMADGRLDPGALVSQRFPIERGEEAYRAIESGVSGGTMGVLLEYPMEERRAVPTRDSSAATTQASGRIGLGVIGAGSFARGVLLPAALASRGFTPLAIASARGLSAAHTAQSLGFARAASGIDEVLADPAVEVVFVLTRHSLHAAAVVAALEAGKHVFVEKPLALTVDELEAIEAALLRRPDRIIAVGYNRRHAPLAIAARAHFADVASPLTVSVRFNAGALPPDHWALAEGEGGRIIGEACHGIDLATFLTGSPPVRVFADAIAGADDECFMTLHHGNGAVSSIAYLAGGDRGLEKERIEILGGGRAAVIDDFRSLSRSAGGKLDKSRRAAQDKGHKAEMVALVASLRAGRWPIAWEDLRAVSLASILAVRSLREGTPFDF